MPWSGPGAAPACRCPSRRSPRQDGHYRLHFRPPLPAEDWNAQISLMTGMAAADMMLGAKVGILRTMPAPDGRRLPGSAGRRRALGSSGPRSMPYGEFLRSLDRTDPGTWR